MQFDPAFWEMLEALIGQSNIAIDRPKGSAHPRYPDFIYPLDYGYLENTQSMDGGGIDLWRGTEPAQRLAGMLVTVDPVKRDSEIKLLIGCSEAEIQQAYRTQNEGGMHALLLRNPHSSADT